MHQFAFAKGGNITNYFRRIMFITIPRILFGSWLLKHDFETLRSEIDGGRGVS